MRCPACRAELPTDCCFCGFCGFRQAPISVEQHRKMSKSYTNLQAPELAEPQQPPTRTDPDPSPIPLTRKKPPTSAVQAEEPPLEVKPRLVVMDDIALDDTSPRVPERVKLPPIKSFDAPAVPASPSAVPAPAPAPAAQPAQPAPPAPEPAAADPAEVSNSRLGRRFPLKVEVGYASEHNFYTGFMENLSSGGIFIATHDPVNIGDSFELTFTVPGLNRPVTAMCEVRWVRDYNVDFPDMVPGAGMKFVNLDAEARAAIELFIRHREPIFFDED